MPIILEKSDRRLLSWVGAIVLLLIVALVFLNPEGEESSVPSSYSSDSSGAKAAYLLLESEGYNIQHWERSPVELPANPDHTVLVLALPLAPADKLEKNALESYLSQGWPHPSMLITTCTRGSSLIAFELVSIGLVNRCTISTFGGRLFCFTTSARRPMA